MVGVIEFKEELVRLGVEAGCSQDWIEQLLESSGVNGLEVIPSLSEEVLDLLPVIDMRLRYYGDSVLMALIFALEGSRRGEFIDWAKELRDKREALGGGFNGRFETVCNEGLILEDRFTAFRVGVLALNSMGGDLSKLCLYLFINGRNGKTGI